MSKYYSDKCKLPKEVGMCRGALKKYFYNSAAKSCQQFNYGGCGTLKKRRKFRDQVKDNRLTE